MPLGPVLIVTGATIKRTQSYRVQLWLAFALAVAGFGAMSVIKADSPAGMSIGLPVLIGVGAGIWSSATYFPVLAPLPVSENAHALALFAFFRTFACVRPTHSSPSALVLTLSRSGASQSALRSSKPN